MEVVLVLNLFYNLEIIESITTGFFFFLLTKKIYFTELILLSKFYREYIQMDNKFSKEINEWLEIT